MAADRQFLYNRELYDAQHGVQHNQQHLERLKHEFFIPVSSSSTTQEHDGNSFLNRQSHLQHVFAESAIRLAPTHSQTSRESDSLNDVQQPMQQSRDLQMQFQQQSSVQPQMKLQLQHEVQPHLPFSQRFTQNRDNSADSSVGSLASPLAVASHQLMMQQNSVAHNTMDDASIQDHTRYTQMFEHARQQRLALLNSTLQNTSAHTLSTACVPEDSKNINTGNAAVPLRGAPTDVWALRAQPLKALTTAANYSHAIAQSGVISQSDPTRLIQGSVMTLNNASSQEHQRKYLEQQKKHNQSRVGWKSYSDYRNAS